MKELLYTLLAVSIIFSSCKKEEEEPTNNSSPSIIGAWTINSVILESDTSISTAYPEDLEILGFATALEFVAGGILYENFSNAENGINQWVIIADSLYIGHDGEDFTAKYHVTNTNLTLVGSLDENMLGITTATMNGTRD